MLFRPILVFFSQQLGRMGKDRDNIRDETSQDELRLRLCYLVPISDQNDENEEAAQFIKKENNDHNSSTKYQSRNSPVTSPCYDIEDESESANLYGLEKTCRSKSFEKSYEKLSLARKTPPTLRSTITNSLRQPPSNRRVKSETVTAINTTTEVPEFDNEELQKSTINVNSTNVTISTKSTVNYGRRRNSSMHKVKNSSFKISNTFKNFISIFSTSVWQ